MRFVFLAPRFHTNQTDLVRKLQEEGHEVAFIVALTGQNEDHSRTKPFVLSQTALGRWINRRLNPSGDVAAQAAYTVPPVRELWSQLRKLDPDIVIVRGFPGLWLVIALPWVLVHRSRLVLYTQGAKNRAKPAATRKAWIFFLLSVLRLRWFTAVERLATDSTSEDLHRELAFIPFFKYPVEAAAHRTYGDPPRFLAVGKYVLRKNLRALIDAFATLPAREGLTLTIVGENTRPNHAKLLDELRERAAELGVGERVRFLQNVKYADVQALYPQCDVFVMSSYEEPASFSQIEAMANGLAVICNRDNGTAHYIDDGLTGILVDSSTSSLSEAMARYVVNPELAARHGTAGFKKLTGPFSVDENYRKLLELITQRAWVPRRRAPGKPVASSRRSAVDVSTARVDS